VNRLFAASEVAGCMACGFLVLAACEAAFDGRWLVERQWSPAEIGLCGLAALMVGQLLAAISRRLFDASLPGGSQPQPDEILLPCETHHRDWRLPFCNFYRTMCLGLVVVATILMSGIVWHFLCSSWGQADSRRLGYSVLALLEAVIMRSRYLKFRGKSPWR